MITVIFSIFMISYFPSQFYQKNDSDRFFLNLTIKEVNQKRSKGNA